MANRFSLVFSSRELVKHLHSYIPTVSILSTNTVCFSTSYPHPQKGGDPREEGSGVTEFMADAAKQGTWKAAEVAESVADAAKDTVDTAWDATKKAAQNLTETTTAEADTNVVDTAEYRCAEDLKGQLGDGCDKKIEL